MLRIKAKNEASSYEVVVYNYKTQGSYMTPVEKRRLPEQSTCDKVNN